jgi:hypothetical protein
MMRRLDGSSSDVYGQWEDILCIGHGLCIDSRNVIERYQFEHFGSLDCRSSFSSIYTIEC